MSAEQNLGSGATKRSLEKKALGREYTPEALDTSAPIMLNARVPAARVSQRAESFSTVMSHGAVQSMVGNIPRIT